ncbi:MAG: bifunctional ADP-dependent NAD(P)H-hydrate dehydratase/NAD(P)H-hydrate epimerase [Geothermobacteraceae bacterium]
MRVLTAQQMRDLDRRTIEQVGIPGLVLMENAGRGCSERIRAAWPDLTGPVLVLCGKGNNGGDGLVIARCLLQAGLPVSVVLLGERASVGGDAAANLAIWERLGQKVAFVSEEEALATFLDGQSPELIVDALLGTGLASEVRGLYRRAIDWINTVSSPVVAVDIPSGVDADNGRILGRAVRAEMTVTFAAAKIGHLLPPGAGCCGRLEVVDIGIPGGLEPEPDDLYLWTGQEQASALLPARPETGHKGTFGHLLVVAGSKGKTGAASLSAAGGLRGGCGLVTLALPASQQPVVAGLQAEIMTEPLADRDGMLVEEAWQPLEQLLPGRSAVALGPGIGRSAGSDALVRRLVASCPLPMVIDADGLNALAEDLSPLNGGQPMPPVLTPHPGEMARLCGVSVKEVVERGLELARDFARRRRVVLVLKGAPTLVAGPDGTLAINGSGNPVLATAGSGDVLTGLIGALLARGMAPFDAARLGVYLHGLAGDLLAERGGREGFVAGDVASALPEAWARLRRKGDLLC